ncbi:ABC transporter substrate-binding protein [Bifidobacterium aquikefiri]|uniref:ABC transporter substrate-binding protein n=1 Tax=Bifidobacterium aquikefiri TaxID=1653207 RepID=UPI0023F0BCFD|nr:ABC transporter substrate-binding protein [Bifidobacterium aquikefiri]
MKISTSIKAAISATMSVALLAAVAACGTTDSSESASSGTASSSAADIRPYDVSSVQKDDAIAALLPASVAKSGTLTVGMDTSYAPAEFLDSDGKTPIGYDVDLLNALSRVLGLKSNPETATFDSIIPSIGSKYDIGISSFTITNERMKAVDFVSYFKAGMSYAVKKGNPQKIDANNLCGVNLSVQTSTTEEEDIDATSKKCVADGKKAVNVLSYKQQTDVTTALVTGKVDVLYVDSPVAGYAIRQTGDQLQTLGNDVGIAPQGVAVKKGDTAMADAVQKAMQKLMDDGMYTKILSHWGAQDGAISKAEINPATSD